MKTTATDHLRNGCAHTSDDSTCRGCTAETPEEAAAWTARLDAIRSPADVEADRAAFFARFPHLSGARS